MAEAKASSAMPVARNTLRRLRSDLQTLSRSPNPMLEVRPLPSNMLKWHFVLHDLPADTPYSGACYHGRLVFPPSYPMAPPSIYMMTPNGRLDVNKKLCLSMTDYHPESWNPAWSPETILVGFLSFFTSDKERGYGCISKSREEREQLAQSSWDFNAADNVFVELFPEFLARPAAAAASSSSDGALAAVVATPPPGPEIELAVPSAAPTDSETTVPPKAVPAAAPAAAPATVAPAGVGDAGVVQAAAPAHKGVGGTGAVQAFEIEDAAGPLVPVVAEENSENDGDAPECWICRDDTSTEPLIQPCACRGSMSYVHASCVELWIARHRRNAINGAAPRCSVCLKQYRGMERRPGVGALAREGCGHLLCNYGDCSTCAKAMCRSFFGVCALKLYLVAAAGSFQLQWQHDPVIVLFNLVMLQKTLTLAVSSHGAAPSNRFAALFFERDEHKVSLHVAEWIAVLLILALQWVDEVIALVYMSPMLAFSLVILLSVLCSIERSAECWSSCGKACLYFLAFVALLPLTVIGIIIYMAYQHPRQTVHPLGPGLHIVVALISVPLLLYESNEPVLILWGSHTALNLLGLCEQWFIRRAQWISGPEWWLAFQLALSIAWFTHSFTDFSKGLGAHREDRRRNVDNASFVWAFVLCALAISVHWKYAVYRYRTWQNRNGHFTLAAAPGAVGGGAAVGGNRVALAGEEV